MRRTESAAVTCSPTSNFCAAWPPTPWEQENERALWPNLARLLLVGGPDGCGRNASVQRNGC